MERKARAFVFTLNNYTDEEETKIHEVDCVYLIVGREVGSGGTSHLQGYVYWKDAKSFRAAKRSLGSDRIHIEAAKGTAADSQKYCSKDGEAFEKGVLPRPGSRSDLSGIRVLLEGGAGMRDILGMCQNLQGARYAELWLKYNERERETKPEVYWLYGPTGTGKSYTAEVCCGSDRFRVWDGKWFDRYDGQPNIILDEFRGDWMKFTRLLKLIDRYPFMVETKGGSRQLVNEVFVFTSAEHPRYVYEQGHEQLNQLMRRIDEIWYFESWEKWPIKVD